MITLAGATFDAGSLQNQYAAGSLEAQVLAQLAASNTTYAYDNLDQLQFELALRRQIVEACYALYRSGMRFATFDNARANPAYWQISANGGFRLKDGAQPDQAIMDIFNNGSQYATECATAMMILYYRALLAVYGAPLFNRLFPRIYLMDWDIREPLLQEVGRPRPANDVLLGDRGYFANPEVNPETPWWQGENVIVLPDGLYYGHGVPLTNATEIIAHLNANRRPGATRSAYFMDSVGRPNFKKLAAVRPQPGRQFTSLAWQPFPAPLVSV